MGDLACLLGEVDYSGTTISAHNINYIVEVKNNGSCKFKDKHTKCIMENISAIFRPGLNAILGATGSGKTTFLNILCGRVKDENFSGCVFVNGTPPPRNFKYMTGYVMQDDIVSNMLSVRENITFSASLRLPCKMSHAKRQERVQMIIDELGLTECSETQINESLSGGERKRTSIGMEMITLPSVLFLDEPTTGLDAHTAYTIMLTLKRLSSKGKNIIFSIHQPRFSILKLFDNITLLSTGESVYHGPVNDALQYFKSIGFECEPYNNPADHFLDVINEIVDPELCGGFYCSHQHTIMNNDVKTRHNYLVSQYKKSIGKQRMDEAFDCEITNSTRKVQVEVVQNLKHPTNWFTQLVVLTVRTFKMTARNPVFLIAQIITNIFLGLIVGSVYYRVSNGAYSAIKNRVGAFFFMVMSHVFSNLSFVDVFINERVLFLHECVSGYYHVPAYFMSKLFGFVIPLRYFPLLLFCSITYWMIGLSKSFVKFLFFILNTWITSLAGSSVPLFLSASVASTDVAMIFVGIIWVFMVIFSGFLIDVDTAPYCLQWLKFLSIFRYSLNAFIINEMKDAEYCSSTSSNDTEIICESGNEYMEREGISYETKWDLWQNELSLMLISFTFLLLAYIQLKRSGK